MKKLFIMAMMLLVLIAGCRPAPTPTPKPAAPTPTPVPPTPTPEAITLRYSMWDPAMEERERQMIAKYEAEHPNVTIEFEALVPKDYWPKMSALAAAGELPDVFNMSSGFIDEWASKGLLENIQHYVDRDINMDDYFAGVFSICRYPDKETGDMYAIPFAWVETALYYNVDAFDEAGVEYPKEGWTWDDFLDAAKKLTVDKDGDGTIDQYGFWFYGRYAHIESWVYQNNGRFLNPKKTRFEPDENAIETLRFLNDLIHVHKVAPMPKEMEGIRQQDVFPQGLAAMWVDGVWNIANCRDIIGDTFKWRIAPVPRGPHWKEDTAYGWSDNMAIAPTSKHKDQAWDFIKFMIGPARTVDLLYPGKVPIYKAVALSEEWLEKDKQPDNKGFILEWGKHTGPTSFTPGWGEWRGYAGGLGLTAWLDKAFNGEIDLDSALEEATKKANEVLERYYPTP